MLPALLLAVAHMIGPGVISTPDDEFGGAITADGQTIFFNRSVPRSYAYYICVAHKTKGGWSKPEVAPFSGQWRDADPMLSLDGKRLYFVSDRPIDSNPKHDFDIWYVEKTAAGWSEPRNLGPPINGDQNEYFVSEAADGTLYFTAIRSGNLGSIDVWRARRGSDRQYAAPENLGPIINGAGITNLEALIAPDQSFLILGSFGRERDPGDSNLYVSEWRDGQWTKPRALSSDVNTTAREYSPRFSPDGKSLIFASERGIPTEKRDKRWTYDEIVRRSASIENGLGNIYEIPLAHEGLPNIADTLLPGPMPEGRFVVAGGHRLHYYRDGHGPVVLFLHGFGGNGTNWSAQFPALRSKYTVIALDELGFGKSAKPHIEYDSDLLAESVVQFLDALHIQRATLVGASMGGHVAARVAAKHPTRVDRLVLMDSSGDSDPSDPPSPQTPSDPKTLEDQKKILEVLVYDQTRITPELVQQRLAAHLAAGDSYSRQHYGSPAIPLRPLLPNIVAPTLLISGEHDRTVPLTAACRFRSDIANSTLFLVRNAAHVPQMEQAEIFNATLLRFLTGEKIEDNSRCATPQLFEPKVISTPRAESGGAFTPDGKEFYFTLRTPSTTSTPVAAICVSRLANGKWQKPEVASFSGRGFDYAPSISPDGKFLVFTSLRDGRYDTDLWMVERKGDDWDEPRRLPAPINSDSNEQSSSIAPDGSLYFSSDRSGGKGSLDIYRAKSGWTDVEPVTAVNSQYTDTHPFVTRDGKLLLFVSSGRPEDAIAGGAPYPRGDIYYCRANDNGWSAPHRLGPAINTAASETYPVVSPDGEWLYFTSEVSFAIIPLTDPITIDAADAWRRSLWNGGGNIYRVRLRDQIRAADK